MAKQHSFSIGRSRQQSESDRQEIKAIKTFYHSPHAPLIFASVPSPDLSKNSYARNSSDFHLSPPATLVATSSSSLDFLSKYSNVRRSASSTSLHHCSELGASQAPDSAAKHEMSNHFSLKNKVGDRIQSFPDSHKSSSANHPQDSQKRDEKDSHRFEERKYPDGRSGKTERRMSDSTIAQCGRQRDESTHQGYRKRKARKDRQTSVEDQSGRNACSRKQFGEGQSSGDTVEVGVDANMLPQVLSDSRGKEHAPRNGLQNVDIRESPKVTQSDMPSYSRRGSAQNHEANCQTNKDGSAEQQAPQRADQTEARPKRTRPKKNRRRQSSANQHSEDAQRNQTTVFIRVHDVVRDIHVLGDVLTAKVNTPGVELTPVETAVKYDDQFTYCSLRCDSSVAQKVMDLILKDKEQYHPLIDCSFVDYQTNKDQSSCQSQNECKQRQRQAEEKERLKKQVEFEISSLSEKGLLKHKEAVDEVEKKVDVCKSKLSDLYCRKDNLAEIAALESKLGELHKQKSEFSTAMDTFRTKLVTLLDMDSFQEDVKFLRKQLGVEVGRLKSALPMYAKRRDILQLVQQNQVSILLAETGSGKSTQVVQYLLEAGFAEQGIIVCTQPRKVAVLSLTARVAEELATKIGHQVGYKAGPRMKKCASTKILYMTDHTLLNEFLTDPDLKAFSCVVVDEAHERSLYTDLLLTMIKRCLQRRPDLKVIITSATIDPQVFVNFFGSCPIMRVSGRAFPVDVVWEDSASEENDIDYIDAAVKKVVEIHRKEPPGGGDILVFLTSAVEIQKCCDMTQQRLKDRNDFQCLPLHGQLLSEEQQKVFKPLERNVRKIVYATNCAETSITIDGIRFVVDTGVAKDMVYDARKKVNSLVVTTISQSSAEQRKGRAGRTAPGTCYRLYSRQSYQRMEKITLPEILKIHLGQALLKLAQLDFTPDMYDFVQSPGQEAIEAALKTLHQLGAMKNNTITDTGKWIVRLPFDPKLGLMTLLGYRSELLYDAIVLASLLSTGSSLFYRGTTDKDHGKLDKAKLKFSHPGGDGLSSLEVYKAWQSVEEKEKNKWCMANSINGKAIRGVRDSVKDILQILKKEVGLDIPQQFSEAPDTADTLRQMIFQSNVNSLCHYLGKHRAGYFAAQASRQVHLHPSSTLCSLAEYPQWVVYDQLLKTSRDFITGITPVDNAWLQNIDAELYGVDVEQVRQKKLDLVFTQQAGCHAFFTMVGPRYTKLRQYEEQSNQRNPDNVIIIEGSKEAGEVRVFSTGPAEAVEALKRQLTEDIEGAVKEVRQETRELTIGSADCGLRVIVGQGGQLTDILMPEETRKVFITRSSDDLTQEQVQAKFEAFGDICYMQQFPSGRNWGFVVYKSPVEAAQAAKATKDDDSNVAELEHRRTVKHKAEFKAKLSWFRRPCNGTAFVDISPAFMSQFLLERSTFIGDSLVNIKMSRNNPDDTLFLSNLKGEVSADLIKRSLLHSIGEKETAEGIITSVHIARTKVGIEGKDKLNRMQESLKEVFQEKLSMSSVEIRLLPPLENSIRYSAHANFTDPIEGFNACKALRERLHMNSQKVDIEPIVSATLQIQRLVYEACKEDLERLQRDRLKDVDIQVEKPGADNWRLHLKADEMQSLVNARTFISDVIKGDVLDCNAAPTLRHLLTPVGRKMLKEAEGQTAAHVCLDARTQTLSIHGSSKACTMMRLKINDYLDEVLSGMVEELTLKGDGQPPGLMKTLINRYDEDLDALRQEAGLMAVTINYHRHQLKMTGPPESIAKAKKMVEKVKRALTEARQQQQPGNSQESIDCIACFCPVDPKELYRLEACAHPYCRDCIKHQVSVAVKDRHLPAVCCQEGCDTPLSWRDFNSLSRLGHLKLPDLASSALYAYVLANRDKVCFCATPNCPMVYRRTSQEDAKTFQCPECSVRVCTACQSQTHEGMTCRMLKSSERAKSEIDKWVKEDSTNRRVCPGCHSPIEKTGGCNKMICDACRTIFCWLCSKTFPTGKACYAHLSSLHGGIFDFNDPLYRW